MNAWIRMLLIMLTSACAAGGTSDVQKKNKKVKQEFTLQLQERYVDGQTQAALILCQKQTCLNPLRNNDGSEFYFHNHAEAYNRFTKKNGIGEKVKFALLGIAAVTGTAGVILLVRHGLKSKKLSDAFPIVEGKPDVSLPTDPKLRQDIEAVKRASAEREGDTYVNKSKEITHHVSSGDGTLSEDQVKELGKQSDWSFGAGMTAASIGAITWIAAFAKDLSTNPHWRHKQKDFEKLFVQGERIVVNKQELTVLLQAINKKLDVQVAPSVMRFLHNR